MAEAFGVAGSAVGIISLALQLGDGILKLKSFWNAVKDAPEEILYILDELDITHVLLTEIEDSLGNQTTSPAAARSLRLCQKGVDILNHAVKELGNEIKRRKKWGGVKMVMKKELLEKMEKRLGRANSLMVMAHQNYIASLSKSRHDEQVRLAKQQFSEMVDIRNTLHSFNSAASIITTQRQTSNNVTSTFITPDTDISSGSRSTKPLSKHQKILNAKLRLPFFSGVWELCAFQQSTSGWTFTLRTYNVVNWNAPIMKMARNGDVPGMQELFQTRQASLFDVDSKGVTLLHTAAMLGSCSLCQFLIDQGADVSIEDSIGRPVWLLSTNYIFHDDENFATMQYLVSRTDGDVISSLPTLLRDTLYIDPESFKWILQSTESPIHERSHRERALLVLAFSKCSLINMKDLTWLTLDDMNVETCIQNLEQVEFFALLEGIIYHLGILIAIKCIGKGHLHYMMHNYSRMKYGFLMNDHLTLIHDLLLASSRYHNFTGTYKDYHNSFLLRLLIGVTSDTVHGRIYETNAGIDRLEQHLKNSIEMWLDQLISAGIDLIEYGQWEKKIYNVERFWRTIRLTNKTSHREGGYYVVSLLNFTYGSKRSDWQFCFTIEPKCIHKGYVEEFWNMVEIPERQIPGAWNFDA